MALGVAVLEGSAGGAFVRAAFFCCRAKVWGLRERERARFSKEESEEEDEEESSSIGSAVVVRLFRERVMGAK